MYRDARFTFAYFGNLLVSWYTIEKYYALSELPKNNLR